MRRLPTWVAALVLFEVGCATEAPQTDLFSIQGAVAGTVVTAAQAPIKDAKVTATAQYPLARGTVPIEKTTLTDGGGGFQLLLVAGNLPDTVAVLTLHVTASGYAAHDTAGLQVRIARQLPPADTTQVAITMAP